MGKDISAILQVMEKKVDGQAVVSNASQFQVLIATVLSQRTRDQNTAKASNQLFEKYNTAGKIANAPLEKLQALVKPAGFYKVKAKRIKEISKIIVERFKGKTPKTISLLLSLPGVGRKTANCVLVYGFGKPAIPVDVHVHRISNRIGLVETKNAAETEAGLEALIPQKDWLRLNHLFVKYGQAICRPIAPKCMQCEIRPACAYFLNAAGKKQV